MAPSADAARSFSPSKKITMRKRDVLALRKKNLEKKSTDGSAVDCLLITGVALGTGFAGDW
jgi:hypothetical protein